MESGDESIRARYYTNAAVIAPNRTMVATRAAAPVRRSGPIWKTIVFGSFGVPSGGGFLTRERHYMCSFQLSSGES